MQTGNPAEAPLNPGIVFDMVQSHQRTAALKAAIDLDLFRAVGEGPGDAASIARHCSASERGIRILCDFLTINGVLAKEDGRYKHTPSSAAFLDPASPACMASVAQFLSEAALMQADAQLADIVRKGRTHLPGRARLSRRIRCGWQFAEKMAPMMGPMAGPLGAVVLDGQHGADAGAGYCRGAWTVRHRDCEAEPAGARDGAGLGAGAARGAEECARRPACRIATTCCRAARSMWTSAGRTMRCC